MELSVSPAWCDAMQMQTKSAGDLIVAIRS